MRDSLYTPVGNCGNDFTLFVTYDYPSQLDENMLFYSNQLEYPYESLISFKDFKDDKRGKMIYDQLFSPNMEYIINCKKDFKVKVKQLVENSFQYKCYANSSVGLLVGYICRYDSKYHLFFHLKNDRIRGFEFTKTNSGNLESEGKEGELKPLEEGEVINMPYGMKRKYGSEKFYIEFTSIKQTDNFQVLEFKNTSFRGTDHVCLYYIFFK